MSLIIKNTEINTTQELIKKIEESSSHILRVKAMLKDYKAIPERECLVSFLFNNAGYSIISTISNLDESFTKLFDKMSSLDIPYVQKDVTYFEIDYNAGWDIKDIVENGNSQETQFLIPGYKIRFIKPVEKEQKKNRNTQNNWMYMEEDFFIIVNILPLSEVSIKKAAQKQFDDILKALQDAKLITSDNELII
jgi:hypothetical protein